MKPGLPSIGPGEGVWCKFRCSINRQLVHEQLFPIFGATTVLDGVAGGDGAIKVDRYFLTQTTTGVVDHQGVDSSELGQIAGHDHGHGVVFAFIWPTVEVGVVDPFFPNHGYHGAWKDRLVRDGDLHHLRWTRCAMVVAVERGRHHTWLDGVNGEGATQSTRFDDA